MDGTVIVPTYDWTSFLGEHVEKCTGIKSYHHLHFSSTARGHVFVRERSDSPEVDINLLKDDWSPSADVLPDRVPPKGLSLTRQWYLYNKIREFCPDSVKDTTLSAPERARSCGYCPYHLLFSLCHFSSSLTTTLAAAAATSTTIAHHLS